MDKKGAARVECTSCGLPRVFIEGFKIVQGLPRVFIEGSRLFKIVQGAQGVQGAPLSTLAFSLGHRVKRSVIEVLALFYAVNFSPAKYFEGDISKCFLKTALNDDFELNPDSRALARMLKWLFFRARSMNSCTRYLFTKS